MALGSENLKQGVSRLMAAVEAELVKSQSSQSVAEIMGFAAQYYAGYGLQDFNGREPSDISASLLGSWDLLQVHDLGQSKVKAFNPDYRQHGWQSGHTVVTILARNMPFITDSVRGEINRRNLNIHNIHSCVLTIVRNADHQLLELLPARSVMKVAGGDQLAEEVLLHFEIGRCTDTKELLDIVDVLQSVLSDVKVVVDGFEPMAKRGLAAIKDIAAVPGLSDAQRSETQLFIEWLCDKNFTFLGYEELAVNHSESGPMVSKVPGSELGLLQHRESFGQFDLYNELVGHNQSQQLVENHVVFSKSSVRSRVHRQVYPDYVAIKRFDKSGKIIGEHRFLGLYTSPVYTLSPTLIPLIRMKVREVLDRSGLSLDNHEGKELVRLLEVFPRDELFQSRVEELHATTMAVNQIQERRQVRLFVRRGRYKKFVNCLVYTPRDVYRTDLRLKLQALLCDAFDAKEAEFTTYFSESVLTRTHFVLRVDPKNNINVDIQALEEEVVKVTMTWKDYLSNYLTEEFGEEQGAELINAYEDAFSPGYMDDFDPRAAIDDIRKIATLKASDDIAMNFYRKIGEGENSLCFRLYHLDVPLALSDVMPILEQLGLRVESEHPYGIKRKDGQRIWVHEFKLTFALVTAIDFEKVGDAFKQAFLRIWKGDAESDAFNKLIIGAQLGWREVAMLRAYAHYMKQIQFSFSGDYIAETLSNHLAITSKIVDLFQLRFNCDWSGSDELRKEQELRLSEEIILALDDVENLSEDRIIRHYLALIEATLRTNYFQRDKNKQLKNYFSFKLSPHLIADMPLPVPMFEIFVYSPRVEGVHLRGGKVARGGLRWSDRMEDFRTEVLGLVKAQQVKNAVIVPTGAKGGFIAKKLAGISGREAMQEEGISCYKIFIQGLLDVTDNLKDDEVIPPLDVVRKDEDDSYLVVAADKGTATFSDIANGLSHDYGFWLGDAFASGGSVGYDHKKMGITAKGAWVSVQRHFRELGVNIQDTDFTVVGVGDMAGDVFGNGMLLSEHIQLVCAFNHMHIFIDPTPDSAASFIERKRLFETAGSSWADYDKALISKGGAVFKRSAKSIAISAEMKQRFDIDADKLTPTELIQRILKSPVDLLWNGGIGTYVKSSKESHADVGDKANDILRVNGNELRCKVIGEGGNLGMTQLSRVEFSLHGGRCNTDFIDNAAGVDCSDHEVNIKILLNAVVASDDMTEKQRNVFLETMTDNVAELVLENNYRQTQAISLAEREALARGGEYRRLMEAMESSGKLNRQLEFLPEEELLLERRANNKGLTRPELSVLISYVKSQLKEELVTTSVPDDAYMLNAVETAFPQRLRDEYNGLIHGHRLRKEIIATQLANDLVNHMGITFVDRLCHTTGVSSGDVVRAYVTARDIFEVSDFWQQIEALDYQVSADVQMELMVEIMRLVRRACRWFIRNRRSLIEPAVEIANFKATVSQLRKALPDIVRGEISQARDQACEDYISKGVPKGLASCIASARELYPFLGIIEAAQSMNASVDTVAEMSFSIADKLELDWFSKQISELKTDNYWQAMARESYRDDLEWQLRTLTVGAMRHICEKGDVAGCIDRWMDQQSLLVARWRAMLAELHATDIHEFAMYSVAIRELLDLAQSSKYGEVVSGEV